MLKEERKEREDRLGPCNSKTLSYETLKHTPGMHTAKFNAMEKWFADLEQFC